jgi:hypothetical protein
MFLNTVKNTFTLFSILLFALAIVGTSCKDDEKTTKDYLVAHDWKVTSHEQANISVLNDCEKDDIYILEKDNSLLFDQGATKCFETDLQQLPGTWSLSASTTPETLTITFEASLRDPIEGKITELADDRFVLTREYSIGGISITDTYTFEKL